MKVLFKQPRSIDGVDYSKGEHQVPDSLESHWFFKACLVNGSVSVLEKGGVNVVPEAPKVPEAPQKPAPNYQEQMNGSNPPAPVGDQQPPADAPVDAKLDIKALQKQAKELGLKAGGKAAEIKARIDEHLAKGEAQAAQ